MIGRLIRLPPVLFLLAVICATALQLGFPVALGISSFAFGMLGGATLWLLAVGLAAAALAEMKKHKTTVEPGRRPSSLVTSGVFAFTRNPLYLSLLLCVAGLALMTDILWFIGASIALGLVLDRVVIKREERVLEETFGNEYITYKNHVRRWL